MALSLDTVDSPQKGYRLILIKTHVVSGQRWFNYKSSNQILWFQPSKIDVSGLKS